MSVNAYRSRLVAITRELANQWEQTRGYWRDARSAEFEHRYLQELQARVDKAATILEKLDGLLAKVRNDCE